jgi:DNA-directed RNA polymerase specialized sigma24 family protein
MVPGACLGSIVRYSYREGLSTRAIAAALRVSIPDTQARVAHARLSLANVLDRRDLL